MPIPSYQRELANQSIIGLPTQGWFNAAKIIIEPDGFVRFNNFQHEQPDKDLTNQYINLNEQNVVTDAIKTIRTNAVQDIKNNPILQNLLRKAEWNYDDRTTWESYTSKIVSERHDEIQGLNVYRNAQISAVARVTDLKDLREDLGKSDSFAIEHDCESMRSIEGIVLTQIENELLPSSPQNSDDYKTSGAYVAINGGVKYTIEQKAAVHAFLISALTGNIIEGTAEPDIRRLPYSDTGKDYTYADFIAGKPTATQYVEISPDDPSTMSFSISVYGSYFGDGDDEIVEKRKQLIEEGRYSELTQTTFGFDSEVVNEEYFKSAFFQSGKAVFTVKKPDESKEDAVLKDDGDQSLGNEELSALTDKIDPFQDILKDSKELTTNDYDDAFFTEMHDILKENGFAEYEKPVVLTTEDGKSYLLYDDSGKIKVYDVTGKTLPYVAVLEFKSKDETAPKPQPVEICTQLHKTSFAEFLDGQGILNDKGYNDANALKDMIQSAKDLGVSKEVYAQIESALSDQKFLETASAIKAIRASSTATEQAAKDGLDAVQKERLVVEAFFKNITVGSLIVDTEKADDKVPYDKAALAAARKMAREMDDAFKNNAECTVIEPPVHGLGAGDSPVPSHQR